MTFPVSAADLDSNPPLTFQHLCTILTTPNEPTNESLACADSCSFLRSLVSISFVHWMLRRRRETSHPLFCSAKRTWNCRHRRLMTIVVVVFTQWVSEWDALPPKGRRSPHSIALCCCFMFLFELISLDICNNPLIEGTVRNAVAYNHYNNSSSPSSSSSRLLTSGHCCGFLSLCAASWDSCRIL